MALLGYAFNLLINFYLFVLFVHIILGWLVAFGVLNQYNQFVQMVLRFTSALSEPALAWIRQYVPPVGGIDLSPLVLFFGLRIIQYGLNVYVFYPVPAGVR